MVKKTESNNFFEQHQDIIIPIIIVIFVILLAFILFLTFGKQHNNTTKNNEEKPKEITKSGILKSQEYKGLEFTNVTLTNENNIYTLSIDVKNTSKETNKITVVSIPIRDKFGNEIITLLGYIGKELAPNEQTTITASTSADLSNAYTKEITEKK